MKRLTTFIMIIAIGSSTALMADDKEDKSVEQMLSSLKMEQIQAEMILESMARRQKLNSEQVERAKREIASVKEDDIEDIKEAAMDRLNLKNSLATK